MKGLATKQLTRREMLKAMGVGLAGSVLAACMPAPAVPTPIPMPEAPTSTPVPAAAAKLVIWWWGEQEAPGAQAWMDETVKLYQEAHPNVSIETVLQSTDNLVPAFKAAAAAKQGPDIQYFWGGVWTLEDAWAGSITPLDDLIPTEERQHYINNFERTYEGQLWGAGWYLSGNPMVYHTELFTKAGLDPAKPPKTWDEFKATCDALKKAGFIPIAGGLKDGWFGGWLFSILGRQPLDSEKDFIAASVGQAKFTDAKYAEWWTRLAELRDLGYWNEDINSLDYQQGQDLFVQGKAVFLFGNDTFIPGWAKTMGEDKIGVTLPPIYSTGKLADTYIVTAQGLGITSWTSYAKESADLLMFMHTPDRVNAWYKATGVLPADDRLDTSLIALPQIKQAYEWDTTKAGPNLENFIPSMLDTEANFAGTQLLFAGEKSPEECAQLAEEVITKWREQNPDAVKNFERWLS